MNPWLFMVMVFGCLFLTGIGTYRKQDDCSDVIAGYLDPAEAQGTHDALNLVDNVDTQNASFATALSASDEFVVPVSILARNLRVDVDAAPGAGDDWTIELYEDGSITNLSCQISDTNTSCTDTTSDEAVAAGADLVIGVFSDDGATAPDAASDLRVSFCLTTD